MRFCEISEIVRSRKSTHNFVRRRKPQGCKMFSKKWADWQIMDMDPTDFQLSSAPYNLRNDRTGLRVCSRKTTDWQITKLRSVDFQLSPAPYNENIEGANFTRKEMFDWQVNLFDNQILPAEQNAGVRIASNSGVEWQVEYMDNTDQMSIETRGVEWQVEDMDNTERMSMETQDWSDYFNNEEVHIDNYETEYVTELSIKSTGSETNNIPDWTSELNGDGAQQNCENEEFDKNIKDVVLSFNKKHDILDDDSRPQLIKRIMDCIFQGEPKKPDFEKIARAICSIYTCETKEVYANGYSGKLYHAYNKRLRQLRRDGILPKSTRALNQIKRMQKPKSFQITNSVQRSINYLFEEQENFDVDECLYHWSNSFDYRQFLLKKFNPDSLFSWSDWKPLELSWSYILICEDFIEMYGEECSQSLIRNWQSTFEEKLKVIRDSVKDEFTKENANRLPASEEYKNITLVNYMNAILFPSYVKLKWRPSIVQAQASVIMVVESVEEISTTVADRLQFCKDKGMEAHPIIFALEPVDEEDEITEFILVYNGTRYHFKHFIEALDVCFKMFLSLHIPFPLESKQFYTVLNELFYKLSLDIKKSAKVLTFLQKMQ